MSQKIFVVIKVMQPWDQVVAPYQTEGRARKERDRLQNDDTTAEYAVDEWFVN